MNQRLLRLLTGGAVFLAALITFEFVKVELFWLEVTLFVAAYLIIGGDVVYKAVRNILRGKVFDENFLMTIATVGALIIGDFPESAAVMLFYQTGEIFQDYAVSKSRKSIASLMDIRPDYANLRENGTLIKKPPEDVKPGDIIVVSAGEKIPLDGTVVEGFSMVDTSALTGEAVPREYAAGSEILSGGINLNGVLTIEVSKPYAESTVSKILDLVENAGSKKSSSENFITKFAKYYTPTVVIIAALLAVLPPLIIKGATFTDWVYRALTFLVVSCPCALVVSIPMSFFGGIGGASRAGILVKGGNYLEALAKTDTVVFDKTGTLTKGIFKVQKINATGISGDKLLELAAYAESYSNHPISMSLKEAYRKSIDNSRVSDFEELAGYGVTAKVDGTSIAAGNAKLMKKLGVDFIDNQEAGTVVHAAIKGRYAGYILIADEIKQDSFTAVKELKACGIKQIVMLTGDLENAGKAVAAQLGIDKVYTGLLPAGKVEKIEELISANTSGAKIAFAGDGINDAPVLARADVGIAMGGLGSDAAIEAADVVIMTDEPSKIATAQRIAKKTVGIATQNIVFAIVVKAVVLILSALGFASMWLAVFADVGVAFLAILNAFRTLNTGKKYNTAKSFVK